MRGILVGSLLFALLSKNTDSSQYILATRRFVIAKIHSGSLRREPREKRVFLVVGAKQAQPKKAPSEVSTIMSN